MSAELWCGPVPSWSFVQFSALLIYSSVIRRSLMVKSNVTVKPQNDYDVVIVGFGVAGASAAIEAADSGARVLVLDRGYGGGAAALSGGVIYAGGGTRYQQAAGVQDSPQNMFNYLRQEANGVVSDETLRHFCETSPAMVDWLEQQGAQFQGTLSPYKASYTADTHYLYYSGNETAWPYNLEAVPAARGHRQVAKGVKSGHTLTMSLCQSAIAKGVEFKPLSRVSELIIEDGAVVGVVYRSMNPDDDGGDSHRKLSKVGGKLGNWVPPIGARLNAKAEKLWEKNAVEVSVRANAVILAAGGFVLNSEMMAKHAGPFQDPGLLPLGTVGDDGTGINLGISAGGVATNLDRLAAWRFLSPPSAFLEGVTVGPTGARIINEDVYGARLAEVMITEHQGQGFLILDAKSWKKARGQVRKQCRQAFQFPQTMYLFTAGHKKADTLDALAAKIGVPPAGLVQTVRAYNDGIASTSGDPGHKAAGLCTAIEQGPFRAVMISIKNSSLYPATVFTLGGLRVDESSGHVLNSADQPISGIYAVGRCAIGICSHSYVSGLSLADGVYSGRRAGAHAAKSAQLRRISPVQEVTGT
ncbi:FAD-binding protein [Rhodococcus sp. ACPA4]|uniref:FAD-binding protein n=1 Tax=Rhodococcus sp. ACPA4 TaxID=2028571 RepID=UPI00211BCE1A|nr:FAD-binding protein [Rhodococcus sp. ACPA4]